MPAACAGCRVIRDAEGPECLSGFCVEGVCCDGPCTGQCEACNVAGSVGTCATAVGIACDDGDPCTTGETCQGGVCTGGQPVECLECQTCAGGACVPVANDTPCEGGVCTDGSCQCVPNCDGRECGDDGCGGSCGTCAGVNKACLDGQCSCFDGLPCSGDCNCWPRVEEDWICVQGGVSIDCAPCTTSAECQDAGWDWCIAASPGPHCPGPICAFHDGVCPGV